LNAKTDNYVVSVVIPTYQRPDYLEKCVNALSKQTRKPDELIIVSRDTDTETHKKIDELRSKLHMDIKNPKVTTPGHIPPLNEGIKTLKGDICCFLDDDCEPLDNWIENILRNYKGPDIGGVGGRYITYENGKIMDFPPAKIVGQLSWFGKIHGNFYRDSIFKQPIDVCFMIGGCASYRSDVIRRVNMFAPLNKDVAFNYEADWGLQVKNMGLRIIYDPDIKTKHYTAPRKSGGMRAKEREAIYGYSHNTVLVALRNFGLLRKIIFVLYFFLIGD
jgi:GT2 family glycosyltransferase